MKNKQLLCFCFLLVILATAISCSKSSNEQRSISADGPSYFPAAHYNFTNNQLTEAGFLLGRQLFYDPLLSVENDISCGTCHQQRFAFSDPSHAIPHGAHGLSGSRNSPGIFNARWMPSFMWDGGITNLEVMPIAPLTNPVEMDETLSNIVKKLQASPTYPSLFKSAFGSDSVTSQLMLRAFAQFMSAMVSSDSKYDRYKQGISALSTDEKDGLELFRSKCGSCHSGELFTDFSFRNNGLDSNGKDLGRFLVTQENIDKNLFRVPSLRNVALTRPYMHDGRFNSLEQVLQHYISGVKQSATLDPAVKNGIILSETEGKKIITFLKTLSDETFINDPRFAKP